MKSLAINSFSHNMPCWLSHDIPDSGAIYSRRNSFTLSNPSRDADADVFVKYGKSVHEAAVSFTKYPDVVSKSAVLA